MRWRVRDPAVLIVGVVALVAGAVPASADSAAGAQATADSGPVATAVHDDTQAKIDSWLADSANDSDGQGGIVCPDVARPDGKMHGEVGAAIGTGGYRSVYGVVNIPLGKQGDKGELTLALSQSRGRGWYGRDGFGGPYAYGAGSYGMGATMLAGRPAWRSRASRCDARFAANCLAEAADPCAPPLR